MLLKRRLIPTHDHERLVDAARRAGDSWHSYTPHLDLFRAELRRAKAVPVPEVPGDVITMNSRFSVAPSGSDEIAGSYTLVYPEAEAAARGNVSVLSPMGQALLGARVGEEIVWLTPAGPEVGVVRRIHYQPEAAGDFHL